MSFNLLFFIFIVIYCSLKKGEENKNKENNFNLFQNNKTDNYYKENSPRQLQSDEFQPIRIILETQRLELDLENEEEELKTIKEALNAAKDIIQKLINVKRINKFKIDEDIKNNIKKKLFRGTEDLLNNGYDCDLVIFVRAKALTELFDDNCFAVPSIFMKATSNDNKIKDRPIVGGIIFNYDYMRKVPNDEQQKIQALKIIFMHEITHILGFEKQIFQGKKGLLSERTSIRINGNDKQKLIFKGSNVVSKAKKYYNCPSFSGLELDTENSLEGEDFLHWEGRLLLGDYMTSNMYYPEQFISEFTLALLEDLGWYKVNYYTGGLMRFGKYKGCDFINKDCMNIQENIVTSSFPNDFCSPTTYGTCSAGRQSRGYCYTQSSANDAEVKGYRRARWDINYGIDNVEFCPASIDTNLKSKIAFYIGNCKIGSSDYGNEIELKNGEKISYGSLSIGFEEVFGSNSFCALSSIKGNIDLGKYNGYLRPTCYPMICGEQSLTIQIGEVYNVCPRKGGMIKIDNKGYTYYTGYLFCPDYNLICTGNGTEICNNLFDCIEKKSIPKESKYDYDDINKVTSQITSDIRTEDELKLLQSVEGYELSDSVDTKCPINCRQCLSNQRCILCRTFSTVEPHAYYIGIKENSETDRITCSEKAPIKGYYLREILRENIKRHYYYECTSGCDRCTNADACEMCTPTHYIGPNYKCVERIPHCKKYNVSTVFIDREHNGGGEGYKECENCNNEEGYYCYNMNKTACVNTDDFTKEIYYKMENRPYSCVGLCNDIFKYCIKCEKSRCFKCDPKHYLNGTKTGCDERIPHCSIYDESSIITDSDGNEGYSECSKCETNHYCIQTNKSICQYINSAEMDTYYDYGNGCKDLCENKYPYCERCNGTHCIECMTKMKPDGTCVPGFPHCKKYNKATATYTYVECIQCDNANNYYCINMNKTSCDKIDLDRKHYYALEVADYPCIRKCKDEYQECSECNSTHCLICNKHHILSLDEKKCLFDFERHPDDSCRISKHTVDFKIEDLDILYFIDYYFNYTFSYLKTVEHFVNENYTVTLFIHSECTEDLLKMGYFKIDSKDLYNSMAKAARTETNEFLFSIFIVYNNKNHFRFHNIYSLYLDPNKMCQSCLEVPYTITNNYNNSLNVFLGPILSNLLAQEEIDIFSKDSEVYTNPCVNITINGIDLPISERYKYIYLKEDAIKIACSGENCEIEKVNNKESSCTCKCKLGNTFEDILKPTEEKDVNTQESTEEEFASPPSASSLKCMGNGFKAKNIKANGGFYISLIAIAGQGVLCGLYFLFSKVILIPKGANPPSKIKNRLKLISTWGQENNTKMRKNEKMCDFQPRDDREEDLFQEEESYENNPDLIFSCSFDSKIVDEKNKDGKKVLVLLKKKKTNDEISDLDEYVALNKLKKRSFCEIYWFYITLKQHIINWFSIDCCNITESYVPTYIKIIRSILITILSFCFNSLFLTQNYFAEKFKYFNTKYKLLVGTTDEITITPEDIDGNTVIPTNERSSYAFKNTIINAIIVFAILLVIQLLLGIFVFNLRNDVEELVKKNDSNEIKEFESKTRMKYIIFLAVNFVIMIILFFAFIGFGGIYGGGFLDYFVPGIISLILLEIFPFLWSLIISLINYIGIKNNNKCCLKVSKFLTF